MDWEIWRNECRRWCLARWPRQRRRRERRLDFDWRERDRFGRMRDLRKRWIWEKKKRIRHHIRK
ncbi:hypothetical protein Tsubulata_023618 [Turnera subulata]|uniref:Uncharacterized protein n=1 Tax=Turnera subulata TaxID=218843 RepID=A0A9Q0J6B4_9ROSI|nr:hypothetical protein Tsubulata_023618 [Turnera subulata]